jgi:hypothetical protein
MNVLKGNNLASKTIVLKVHILKSFKMADGKSEGWITWKTSNGKSDPNILGPLLSEGFRKAAESMDPQKYQKVTYLCPVSYKWAVTGKKPTSFEECQTMENMEFDILRNCGIL